jgi:hypothetical protein
MFAAIQRRYRGRGTNPADSASIDTALQELV